MLSDAIKEFSDIYFVCHVDANPPVKEITWLHNELPINELTVEPMSETQAHSLGASRANVDFKVVSSEQLHSSQHDGLIISNNSLVLQRVKLEQRGHYACVASNSEGLSESNRIKLRVLRKYPTIYLSIFVLGTCPSILLRFLILTSNKPID